MIDEKVTVYVYYKIPTHQHSYFLLAVKNLNHAIKELYPFLETNHLKRPLLDADNRELWMETYQGIPSIKLENFYDDLAKLAEQNELPSERKYEAFISL